MADFTAFAKQKTPKKPAARDFGGTVRRLLHYFAPYRYRVFAMIFCALLGVFFNILGPKILGEATNIVAEGVAEGEIQFLRFHLTLVSLVVVYGLSAAFTFTQQKVTANVAQTTLSDLRTDVDKKIHRLPLNYYDTHTHGDILSRTTTDIETISTTLQQLLTQFITSAFTIVGIIIMMLTISWQMTVIALLVLPAALSLCTAVIKRSQKYYIGQQGKLGGVSSYVEELYSGHTIMKLYGTEDESCDEFFEMNDKLYEDARRAQFTSSIMMPLTNLVGNIGYVCVCVFGGVLASGGHLTVGAIQAFIQYMQQFTLPITQTTNIINLLQSTIAAAERVFSLLDEEVETPERETLQTPEKVNGDIVFDGVQFGYTPNRLLITNMNVHVKAGQKVGICGPTGAGKTTLINLLMRFYNVNGGTIRIDGIDSYDMSRETLRRLFGMVLQDTWLYSASIRDNIRYGRPEATDEEVENACRMANADFFIRSLPNGYETMLEEDAANFSAGQKQLLTIARAFCANPQILILDEATSSVDTRTEKLIGEAMARLTEGKTNFQIAHRLSTIRDSDLILVLRDGDLVEQGNHDELLAINGTYAELYRSQFA